MSRYETGFKKKWRLDGNFVLFEIRYGAVFGHLKTILAIGKMVGDVTTCKSNLVTSRESFQLLLTPFRKLFKVLFSQVLKNDSFSEPFLIVNNFLDNVWLL